MLFRGTLPQLQERASEYAGGLCKVTIQTETPTPQLRDAVERILTNATVADVDEDCLATRLQTLEPLATSGEEPDYRDLFKEFVNEVGTRVARAELVTSAFEALMDSVETQQPPKFPELDGEEVSHETTTS